MKKLRFVLTFWTLLCFSAIGALAQTSNIVRTDLSQLEVDRIIQTFTRNE